MANKFFSPESLWLEKITSIARIITGILLIYHGVEIFDKSKMTDYGKMLTDVKMSKPLLMAYLGKGSELASGILLTAGLFTRIGALLLIVTMISITFRIGEGRIFMEEQHPFLFCVLGVVFFFSGGDRWSADNLLFGRG